MIQFNRTVQLVLGNMVLDPRMRVTFHIEKEMTAAGTSKCEIKVYNLSQTHLRTLETTPGLTITLSAGYAFGGNSNVKQLITTNGVAYITHEQEGPDHVTNFECLPGSLGLQTVYLQVAGAQNDQQIYTAVLNAFSQVGVARGHISSLVLNKLLSGQHLKTFSKAGTAAQFMDLICRRHHLHWDTNDNALSVYAAGEYAFQDFVSLTPGTGLVGIPSKTTDAPGTWKIKALLNADIVPGNQVVVTSQEAQLNEQPFYVNKVTYTGDNDDAGGDFYAEVEGVLLGKHPTFLVVPSGA